MCSIAACKASTIFMLFLIAAFIFVVWFQQVTQSGWCNDESAHISAGIYHLDTGYMDAYRVNPPLPRMVAVLPLLVNRPQIEWFRSKSPYVRSEYMLANEWISENLQAVPRYLLAARSVVLLFFAIGLWSIICWTNRLYGTAAACLAGAMWLLNPDVIANAAVVAPDLPAASTGLLVGYLFWDWLQQSQRRFPWLVATGVALAILCKFSWLFLLLALPVITLVYDGIGLTRRNASGSVSNRSTEGFARLSGWTVGRDALRLAFSFSLTVLLINWCYGFEGTGTRLGDFEFISESLIGDKVVQENTIEGGIGNRFAVGPLAWLPVPFPREMVQGIDYLKWEFEKGLPCYLRGTWQHGGWWYFHLYAMAVKMPLGYWALIGGGLVSLIWQVCRRGPSYPLEWLPILIAVVFMALISSQTGFTHHVRYVLPAYGFLFLVAARVMVVVPRQLAIGLAVVCLSGTVCFHIMHLGLAHTFFNPIAGGPNNGWRHLSYSNVDWGQSVYRMVDWVKKHPEQRPMTVLFRSSLGNPEQLVAGIEEVATRTDWLEQADGRVAVPARLGWYLISSYRLTREENRFFWNRTPVAQPYPDVLLFFVDAEEIDSQAPEAKVDRMAPLSSNISNSVQ